jgi:membrane-anchored glycerophosphoryl diester phosphodiesterase (GDPDase)
MVAVMRSTFILDNVAHLASPSGWTNTGHVILRRVGIGFVQVTNVMKFLGRSGISQLTIASILALQVACGNVFRRFEFTMRTIEIIRAKAWLSGIVTGLIFIVSLRLVV